MERIKEGEFLREYNKVYGKILRQEREKRQISREKLAYGIMSRTALEKVEKGQLGWSKFTGDTMLQRMGISADYFETLSTAEELDRWRMREDICLLTPDSTAEAWEKLEEYRSKYEKRESLEEQFLLKAEVILMLAMEKRNAGSRREFRAEAEEKILSLARRAADCTIPKGWEQGRNLANLLLAPAELEAILLVGAVLFLLGREKEAWELQQAVWNYPWEHQWKERLQVLILPQAAILGIRLLQGTDRDSGYTRSKFTDREKNYLQARAFDFGKESLELLRRSCCHCYALPLLESLCRLSAEEPEKREYLEQARKFKDAFQELYQWFDYPEHRLWQGISVDNTLEVGLSLRMLRKFYGKSKANAVYDEDEVIVTERQLEKIEKGIHKPSYENYNRLAKQYGKYGGWNMPLLEMVSADVLELRQEISTLNEFRKYEEAEWKIGLLRKRVDVRYPRARQELLFLNALMKWKMDGMLEESLNMMLEALRCTVSDFDVRDMKWWVFQREEMMLASNIASLYRRLGHLEEAGRWFEAVIHSVEQQSMRTGVCSYGYDILMSAYDNYLGDIHSYDKAAKMNIECNEKVLKLSKISGVQSILYRIAWNAYESDSDNSEEYDSKREKWSKAFQLSEIMSDFMEDSYLKEFLGKRKQKYLLEN